MKTQFLQQASAQRSNQSVSSSAIDVLDKASRKDTPAARAAVVQKIEDLVEALNTPENIERFEALIGSATNMGGLYCNSAGMSEFFPGIIGETQLQSYSRSEDWSHVGLAVHELEGEKRVVFFVGNKWACGEIVGPTEVKSLELDQYNNVVVLNQVMAKLEELMEDAANGTYDDIRAPDFYIPAPGQPEVDTGY
jgi:hypothetical protein